MKYAILTSLLVLISSCGVMPQLLNEAEHIADDTAVKLTISQEAIRKDTNVTAQIKVFNSKLD